METISFKCHKCDAVLTVDDEMSSRLVRCSECHAATRCPGVAGAVDLTDRQWQAVDRAARDVRRFPLWVGFLVLLFVVEAIAMIAAAAVGIFDDPGPVLLVFPAMIFALWLYMLLGATRLCQFLNGGSGTAILLYLFFWPAAVLMTVWWWLRAKRAVARLMAIRNAPTTPGDQSTPEDPALPHLAAPTQA